ncbi:MAG: alpha/beta hydrolase [Gammaproteobacteria bacterium]
MLPLAITGAPRALAATAVRPTLRSKKYSVSATDGVTLAVESWGNAEDPGIVLVHGLGQSRLAWLAVVESLAAKFHVVAYDLRGHGESDKPLGPEAYIRGERWAEDLQRVMQAAQLQRPAVVVWSLGGVVVSHYLRVFGEDQIGRLVFVGAVTDFSSQYFEPATGEILSGLEAADLSKRTQATRAFVDASVARPLPQSLREDMLVWGGMVPSRVHAAIRQLQLVDADESLRKLKRPTLVIHGARDKLVKPAMGQHTHALIAGSRYVTFSESGHGPMFDEPDKFNATLAGFCS